MKFLYTWNSVALQCFQICNSKRWLGISLFWGTTCYSVFSFLHWRWRQHLALYLPGPQSLYLCTRTVGVQLLYNEHDISLQTSPYTANCHHQPMSTENAFTHWLATKSWGSVCKIPRFANIQSYCSYDVKLPWESWLLDLLDSHTVTQMWRHCDVTVTAWLSTARSVTYQNSQWLINQYSIEAVLFSIIMVLFSSYSL